MKNEKVIMGVRIVLGLLLFVFGLNKFLNFMPAPELPVGAGLLMMALAKSGYIMTLVGVVEVLVGVMLLANKYVALALLLLAPITVNILAFHLVHDMAGIGGAALVTILNVFLFLAYKDKYSGVLTA
jgi:hypothetical protein